MPALPPGPLAPSDVEVLRADVPYGQLENRGDEFLEDELRRLRLEPAETRYRLLRLPLTELRGAICAPEDYLSDGDEEGYEKAVAMREALESGRELPPIVLVYGDDYSTRVGYGEPMGRWVVVDGFHRLCAHGAAGSEAVLAYQLV